MSQKEKVVGLGLVCASVGLFYLAINLWTCADGVCQSEVAKAAVGVIDYDYSNGGHQSSNYSNYSNGGHQGSNFGAGAGYQSSSFRQGSGGAITIDYNTDAGQWSGRNNPDFYVNAPSTSVYFPPPPPPDTGDGDGGGDGH